MIIRDTVFEVSAFFLMVIAAMFCARCDLVEVTSRQSGHVLVVIVGGLGESQMKDITAALSNSDATVVSASSWDGYKLDIAAEIKGHESDQIILVGHSFGGQAVLDACKALPAVHIQEVILIDPVAYGSGGTDLPANAGKVTVFTRTDWFGPWVAVIQGTTPIPVPGSHNDIPHSTVVINYIRKEVAQ
jgi:pimeloyl-ACP methyl ester carboxylesterase